MSTTPQREASSTSGTAVFGELLSVPTGRPAETGGAAAAIGTLVAIAAGVDAPGTIAALVAVVGLAPAAITGLINAGGVRGFVSKLWRGRA